MVPFNRIKAPAKLYLLVFVMSAFIIGIGWFGMHELKALNENTQTLYSDRIVPIEQLTAIRFSYAAGILSVVQQAKSHQITFREAGKQIRETEKGILAHWKAYKGTYLTPEETKKITQTELLMAKADETIQELDSILNNQDALAFNRITDQELYSSVTPVLSAMNDLIELQVRISGEIYKYSNKVYNSSLRKFYILIAVSLAFALILGFYIVANIKKLIRDLRESESKYRNIFENVQDVFYQTSLEGVVLDVSPSIKNHTGYSRDELIGTSTLNLFYDLGEREEALKLLRENGKIKDYELRFKSNTDELVYISLSAAIISDAEGNPSHQDGSFRNITERKKAEESIRQSEANYRQLFDLSPAPMWLCDEKEHKFIKVNQACILHFGYSEEEFAEMSLGDIRLQTDAKDIINTGQKNQSSSNFMGEGRHIKKSGEIIDMVTSSMPVLINGQEQILMVAIDVTERKLYEQRLTRAAIKAQEDERYEIGGELHDNVCQILAASLMFLGVMKKTLPANSEDSYNQTHQYITLATEEIRSLSHRLAPAFFDDATLEYAFKNLLKKFNIENKYEVIFDFDANSKNFKLGRDLQLNLYRILQEQLRNILKYANASVINIKVTLNDTVLRMHVADNGIGFDVKSVRDGIGLANMDRRAQLFSGNFTINSAVGKGCEIIVEIPITNLN